MDYINYVKQSPMSMSGMGGPVGGLNFHSGSVSYNWNGDRAIGGGGRVSGNADTNMINYFSISNTSGNSSDFGDLTASMYGPQGTSGGDSSAERGVIWGGWETPSVTDKIDYITIANTGNASDFGNRTVSSRQGFGSCSNGPRCCYAGGVPSTNVIDYITITTTGNATDFGNLTQARNNSSGTGDGSRGIFWGGSVSSDGSIQYITIESTGNATNFGDLTGNTDSLCGSFGNGTHCMIGGLYPSGQVINKITVQTTGNATTAGVLSQKVNSMGGASNASIDRGVWYGGQVNPQSTLTNNIEMINISSGSDSTDFSGSYTIQRGMGSLSGS